jgi:predicted transcriptional regulator
MSGDPGATDDTDEPVSYDPDSGEYSIYECQGCGNVVLSLGQSDPPMSCHGEPMQPVDDVDITVEPPDIREVLLDAFGLPKPGLDICLCVISEGPLPAGEVAGKLGYDRTTVTRYLNKLVDLGLLKRSELNREGGGIVNVYHSIDVERMRRETLVGFYMWAGEAASLIEDANLTKQEYLADNPDQDLPDVFWESFSDS